MDYELIDNIEMLKFGNTIQLVGAIYAGEGKVYLCPTPGDERTLQECDDYVVLLLDNANWDKFLQQTDFQNVEVTNGVEKAILRKTQRVIDTAVSWEVFRRDGFSCCYCGRDDIPLTVDHLVVWEEGGPSIPKNLLSACKKCNKTRGNKPYAEWLQHEYYRGVSRGISPGRKKLNESLVETLDEIPRLDYIRKRK